MCLSAMTYTDLTTLNATTEHTYKYVLMRGSSVMSGIKTTISATKRRKKNVKGPKLVDATFNQWRKEWIRKECLPSKLQWYCDCNWTCVYVCNDYNSFRHGTFRSRFHAQLTTNFQIMPSNKINKLTDGWFICTSRARIRLVAALSVSLVSHFCAHAEYRMSAL